MKWNIFRYLADFSHLISVMILLHKMIKKRTCAGLSLKTQFLFLIVFIARYVNGSFFSPPVYNIVFRIFYIVSAAAICYLMWKPLKQTYDHRHDTFRAVIVIVLAIPFALFTMPQKTVPHFFFAYSLWVECVAIIPQLMLLGRTVKFDALDRDYVFFLAIYRLFYLLNWIYKMVTGTGKTASVIWITGIIQTLVFSDFIYEYLKLKVNGKSSVLPI
ncbi:ER lumen protein retaining receptor [Tritrichomonas foetus]|uniref:ER lumen protein retaining receptor n=1 Tax=Tritrichomonas foetus TaxID=1144522 RepID=A0A1J4J9E5_9EUKA|nr:ER lumen protein retaining receptor [Tritrichomonas foetus]|eukprot:OHS95281.1 ER lumen protein retaining receptor [Tritrichomonas foetus]